MTKMIYAADVRKDDVLRIKGRDRRVQYVLPTMHSVKLYLDDMTGLGGKHGTYYMPRDITMLTLVSRP